MEQNEPDYQEKQNERPLKEQTPDEAKMTVKEKVSRGVAMVAGALEGFTQQMRKNDVPEKSKEAVEKVGETTRKVSEATRKEGRQVKESLTGSTGSSSRQAMPVTGTAHKEGQLSQQTEFEGGSGGLDKERTPFSEKNPFSRGQPVKKDDLSRR